MRLLPGVFLLFMLFAQCTQRVAAAEDAPGLARQMTWAAYGTTSSGYVQAIAVSNTLRKFYGTSVRIIPGKNDISRIMPMKTNQAQYCACGYAELYFAQEGLTLFSAKSWGPQRLRVMFTNRADGVGNGLVMAGNLGIKTLADLKGKRVAWIRGSPALQTGTTAVLAFAGLTWDDVQRIDVPGYRQGLDAIINNSVDATWASTPASHVQRIAASPRGVLWPVFPADDQQGWARLWSFAPHFSKMEVNQGVALENNTSGKVPFPGLGTPYPVFVGYDRIAQNDAYALTKGVMSNYKDFENAAPSMESFAPDRQTFHMVLPYHPGAIRYFREIGMWTPEDDRYNDTLLHRQDVLAAAWQEAQALELDDDAFAAAWLQVREQRLTEAGLETKRPTPEASTGETASIQPN